jgi:hypothetical protein
MTIIKDEKWIEKKIKTVKTVFPFYTKEELAIILGCTVREIEEFEEQHADKTD